MNQVSDRKYIIGALIVLVCLILIGRLFYLQVIETSYKTYAYSNTRRIVIKYPARGLIFDRNHKLLVRNAAAYDLNINPVEVSEFDTAELSQILEYPREKIEISIRQAREYSIYKPSVFDNMKLLSSKKYAYLQEKLYKFPGFFVQPRTIRDYAKEIAPHALGYVAEVSEKTIQQKKYYKAGDYTGISGVEKSYEEELRGKKGREILLVDVHNTIKGSYQDGKYDKPAKVGKNIVLTIDSELQRYGEKLMECKIGSIVMLDPRNGEILAVISSPKFNPSLLAGRKFPDNFAKLSKDTLKPLFDRACQASYPPGSTFKPIQAAIALQDSILTPRTRIYCDLSLVGDLAPPGYYNIHKGIKLSCNNFFYRVFKMMLQRNASDNPYEDTEIGFEIWRKHLLTFGLGNKLGSDLLHEKGGFIPTNKFYDEWYGDKRWKTSTIYSNAIGQGEVLVVPLQLANIAAIFANRGYYYIPHIIKKIEGKPHNIDEFKEKHYTSVDSVHFSVVVDAMEAVVKEGSGKFAYMKDIPICGKTGTAENPHGEDHSLFMAFAPKDTPRVAVAVCVENSGYGGSWAAPIASLMIEKYLTDTVKRFWIEDYILNKQFIPCEEE